MIREFAATSVLRELRADNLLPAILFRTARRQCDADIDAIGTMRGGALPKAEQEIIEKEVWAVISKYSIEPEILTKHPHYQTLVTVGAGAHHAGQLLMWRLLLEELMSRGVLRLMIATGTVAAGVDFPARSVIITAHSKRGADGFGVLTAAEFQQMSGRAGRRGKDVVGICLIAPGAFSDARVVHQLLQRPPEPLRSAYFAAPSSVLNLLKYRSADELRYIVQKSLAAFLDRKAGVKLREEAAALEVSIKQDETMVGERRKKAEKRVRRMLKEAEDLEGKQAVQLEIALTGLTKLGYIENGSLTVKGQWAANLCTSLVLELAEAIESGLFYDLTVEELAAVVGSIAGDSHRTYFSLKKNPIKPEYFKAMQDVVARVKESFDNRQTTEIGVVPDAALTVLTWMESDSWVDFAGLLRLAGVAEGDAARVIMQTADHLSQIARLEESHPPLAASASEARRRLLRPPLSEALIEG